MVDKQQLLVADIRAWRTWLEENHSSGDGVWLVLAKKDTLNPTSLTYLQALEEALCFGWIDGQARSGDEGTFTQSFTPRRNADGDEAWAMISRHKPSVVLLDVQMPGRTGLEVLAMMRGDPSLSTTRVILLTARALKADVEVGLAAGADLYLTKPFSPLDLLTRVDEALVQWRSDQPPGSLYTPAA